MVCIVETRRTRPEQGLLVADIAVKVLLIALLLVAVLAAVLLAVENSSGTEMELAPSATAVNLMAAARWIIGHAGRSAKGASPRS